MCALLLDMRRFTPLFLFASVFAPGLLAQGASDLNARISAVEAAAQSAQSAGDNAWMLTSAALVLLMTVPGLALFYGGLVRRKNVLGTMMQSFVLMAQMTVTTAIRTKLCIIVPSTFFRRTRPP